MAYAFVSAQFVVENPAQAIRPGSAPLRVALNGKMVEFEPQAVSRLLKAASGKLPTYQAIEVDAVLARQETSFSASTRTAMLTALRQVIDTGRLNELARPVSQRAIC